MSLAVPAAEARTREDVKGSKPSVVQLVKQWVVRTFGDGLIVPRP